MSSLVEYISTKLIVICGGIFVGAAAASDRVALEVDFEAAETALNEDKLVYSEQVSILRGIVGPGTVSVPVVLPMQMALAPSAKFAPLGDSYIATYRVDGVDIGMAGTVSGVAVDMAGQGAFTNVPTDQFRLSDDGAELSWTKFGAAYTLTIACISPTDSRCRSPDYLDEVRRGNVVVLVNRP
jgi:hypothetical protein